MKDDEQKIWIKLCVSGHWVSGMDSLVVEWAPLKESFLSVNQWFAVRLVLALPVLIFKVQWISYAMNR